MPLTPFQVEILRILARNRSPDSYIAGGIALNARESVRWSVDIDVFHDVERVVMQSSDADMETLRHAGYSIQQDIWTPTFRRAWVSRGNDGVKLEWCQDSAWRFFPIEADEMLGWKLHRFDALTNKALAMGSRSETRDLVDLVANAGRFPLHAVIWAACAKDPGFTPPLLLDQMRRNSRIDAAQLREMGYEPAPAELKKSWLALACDVEREIERAAKAKIDFGVAFIDPEGRVGWFDSPGHSLHRVSLGGTVPRIAGVHYEIED